MISLSLTRTQDIECDSITTVQEFVSHINQEIGLHDTHSTGFALMSDWPGEEDIDVFISSQTVNCLMSFPCGATVQWKWEMLLPLIIVLSALLIEIGYPFVIEEVKRVTKRQSFWLIR